MQDRTKLDLSDIEGRHQPWKFHTCKVCSYRSKFAHLLIKHMREIHRREYFNCHNDLTLYKCPECEFETLFKVYLKTHIHGTHDQLNEDHKIGGFPRGYGCTRCHFHTFTALVSMRHLCKNGSKWLKCEKCPYKSKRNSNLRKHISICNKSDNIDWFECEQCPHKTKRKNNLKRHITVCHRNSGKIKCFKCDLCPYEGKTKACLRVHQRKHEKEYNCEHCSYKTCWRGLLKRHVLRRHTDPSKVEWFRCEHCSYKAKVKYDLIKHNDCVHSNESKGKRRFQCELCSYATYHGTNLRNHILRKHTDPSKIEWLQCEHCSYKAKVKSDLIKHADTAHHTDGIKRFRCEFCSYGTNNGESYLKKHILRNHSQKSNQNIAETNI